MKKVVYIFLILVFIGIASGSKVMLENTKSGKKLDNDISKIKEDIETIKKENEELDNNYSTLEEESKDLIEELKIWEKAKEKLEKAL